MKINFFVYPKKWTAYKENPPRSQLLYAVDYQCFIIDLFDFPYLSFKENCLLTGFLLNLLLPDFMTVMYLPLHRPKCCIYIGAMAHFWVHKSASALNVHCIPEAYEQTYERQYKRMRREVLPHEALVCVTHTIAKSFVSHEDCWIYWPCFLFFGCFI